MHIKKRGSIIIEVILIIFLLVVFITAYSKLIVNSMTKSQYYLIKDDILTLSVKETTLVKEFTEYINTEKNIKQEFIDDFINVDIVFVYSTDKNTYIEVKEGSMYIVDKKSSSARYRQLDYIKKEKDEDFELIINPTLYVTEYIKRR